MNKIFSAEQMRQLDQTTIVESNISSWQLMERASQELSLQIAALWFLSTKITIVAGPGNNGGDALAVARMLQGFGFEVTTYLLNFKQCLSQDCMRNKQLLLDNEKSVFHEITTPAELPETFNDADLIIDGLFGTGLNKPLTEGYALCVSKINEARAKVLSIDMPSGLMSDGACDTLTSSIVRADYTYTFQHYKLSLLLDSTAIYAGQVNVLPIGLSAIKTQQLTTPYYALTPECVNQLIRPRPQVSHKGTFGHALLIAGQYGMAGAAILASKACLRSGVGKLTIHTPSKNNDILQISVPEAILSHDISETHFTQCPESLNGYQSVGVGPGLGLDPLTESAFIQVLQQYRKPIVVDADALNILARHPELMQHLPQGSILTPHVGELKRLGCTSHHSYEQLQFALALSKTYNVYVVLKGHHSAICMPSGEVYFNVTGNSGLATAGSGDVLAGILTSLLAQGYSSSDACRLGVCLHGVAADCIVKQGSEESLVASDIIDYLPQAINQIRNLITNNSFYQTI